jgi:hypothetical protein
MFARNVKFALICYSNIRRKNPESSAAVKSCGFSYLKIVEESCVFAPFG